MIERPERREHQRREVDEVVTVSGSDRHGLVILTGTIVDTSPGGLRIMLSGETAIDPSFVADIIVSRAVGTFRHLVVRALEVDGRTLRAAFVDPATVDPSDWLK
jgi:hypothetical protein